ncbi:hypothetical protein H920_08610 [Fukomys damarensis]|uniref:Uncharacterized protein n=1 Tax=Fukomys damarensis TaxID=885580 RepID=A0A091DFZ9_FUKDA|nr:hypothetical protein H920_08610 [Fukomys damarensis]
MWSRPPEDFPFRATPCCALLSNFHPFLRQQRQSTPGQRNRQGFVTHSSDRHRAGVKGAAGPRVLASSRDREVRLVSVTREAALLTQVSFLQGPWEKAQETGFAKNCLKGHSGIDMTLDTPGTRRNVPEEQQALQGVREDREVREVAPVLRVLTEQCERLTKNA